ncbi:MAG: DMT family transporter [Clostridia bacterium]|nr:DMT family transporter [Clostridia bacterium]
MKKGIIYALITAILFVTLEPVSKLVANDISPFAITFWRFLIGSFILVPPAIAKIKKEKIHITLKDIGLMTALGILFICISMVLLQVAVKKADSPSLIAIIFSSNSVFTILFAMIFIKEERLTKNKLIALILGILGVIICADFSSGTNLGSVTLAILAALSFSLYTALSQKYMKKLGGLIQSSGVFLSGSIVLLMMLLILKIDVSMPVKMYDLTIMLYLGLFVTGTGYALYFKAIEKGGAIMASLAFFIKPILTPFVTFFINEIVPDVKVFIAVACIVAASYFSAYRKNN